jgi:hypothetical protein
VRATGWVRTYAVDRLRSRVACPTYGELPAGRSKETTVTVDAERRQEAVEALARRLLAIAPDNVVQVYGGFQAPADAERHFGAIVGAADLGDRWGFGQFDQDPVVFDLVREFWEASGDEPWTTCEIKVDRDGAFTVDLGYAPLPDGADIDRGLVVRLEDYGSSFVAEHGERPAS